MNMFNEKQNNIADKAGTVQKSPGDLVFGLISDLKPRTKDILTKRFGLKEDRKKTLEEIGKIHGITRERVRQIESATLKELKKGKKIAAIEPCELMLEDLINENGKIVEHKGLIDSFSNKISPQKTHENIIEFILNISDRFYHFDESDITNRAWGIKGASLDIPKKVIDALINVLSEKNKPIKENEAINKILNNEVANSYNISDEKAIKSYLSISKEVLRNPFNEWGLASWSEIIPRGVKDKAYLVLKKHGRPMHFTDITEKINDVNFHGKNAIPQTVHNELIKDRRFVLVGRGIYGLVEWGYSPGTVAEVIEKILTKAKNPMNRDEIIEEVLKQRLVRRNTVVLALQDKNRFKKLDNKLYTLL